jgi:hypothetical protein
VSQHTIQWLDQVNLPVANYFVVVEPIMQQEIAVFETILLNLQTPVQRVLATTWFVNSPLNCRELYQKLSSIALPGDRFIVIAARECAYDNLSVSSEMLESCWDATARC